MLFSAPGLGLAFSGRAPGAHLTRYILVDESVGSNYTTIANRNPPTDDHIGTDIATASDPHGRPCGSGFPTAYGPLHRVVSVNLYPSTDGAVIAYHQTTSGPVQYRKRPNPGTFAHLHVAQHQGTVINRATLAEPEGVGLFPTIDNIVAQGQTTIPELLNNRPLIR